MVMEKEMFVTMMQTMMELLMMLTTVQTLQILPKLTLTETQLGMNVTTVQTFLIQVKKILTGKFLIWVYRYQGKVLQSHQSIGYCRIIYGLKIKSIPIFAVRDGKGDACEEDADNDGIDDAVDNCKFTSNTDQMDVDADGIGDMCDNCKDESNPGYFTLQ